jgi:hypothetical protein
VEEDLQSSTNRSQIDSSRTGRGFSSENEGKLETEIIRQEKFRKEPAGGLVPDHGYLGSLWTAQLAAPVA